LKILIQKLESFPQIVLNSIIFIVIACFALFSFIHYSSAAVAPNRQYGQCGPYYLWYQIGPDSYTYSGDYVDLCEITFDISDVLDDFDFVYFTESRALLDKNRDGISDQWYFPEEFQPQNHDQDQDQDHDQDQDQDQNQLPPQPQTPVQIKWKPTHGCVRINLRDCWGTTFNEYCGYAMISIQPKAGFPSGSARIPVSVTKRCPPYGADCSETAIITHDYSNCYVPMSLSPDFIVHKHVEPLILSRVATPEFKYTVTVQNTGEGKGDTMLTDIVTNGSNGGILQLSEFKIECPKGAGCFPNITDEKIQILLLGVARDYVAVITYILTGNAYEISNNEVSYFTNTATLSNGHSSQVTVGIRGMGPGYIPGQRPERPRPGGQSK
jgi:hypothetical protein